MSEPSTPAELYDAAKSEFEHGAGYDRVAALALLSIARSLVVERQIKGRPPLPRNVRQPYGGHHPDDIF